VGGLQSNDGNKWAVRVSGTPIKPWNMNQVIDDGATRQAFIENLIRHCTYLQDEMVLPKRSLLYEKFMVLNELNNVKIAGEPISVDLKQDIYNELFMKGKAVTRKKLYDFLVVRGKLHKGEESLIGGIEDRFRNSLTSIGKFGSRTYTDD
jgi:CRISPR-associated endonuclease Csn1